MPNLLPDPLSALLSDAAHHVEFLTAVTGVAAVEAYFVEDAAAVSKLTDGSVWLVCDRGLAHASVTMLRVPPGMMRPDPIMVKLTPWSDVHGLSIIARKDRPAGPVMTVVVTAESPPMQLLASGDDEQALDQLRVFVTALVRAAHEGKTA